MLYLLEITFFHTYSDMGGYETLKSSNSSYLQTNSIWQLILSKK